MLAPSWPYWDSRITMSWDGRMEPILRFIWQHTPKPRQLYKNWSYGVEMLMLLPKIVKLGNLYDLLRTGQRGCEMTRSRFTVAWSSLYTDPQNSGDLCLRALHKVRCPTLVIHGMKDIVPSLSHVRYLVKQIATSELVLFPDDKHNVHQRFAEEFHAAVKSFLLDKVGDAKENEDEERMNGDANGPAAFDQIEEISEIKGEPLLTLLSACVSLKLIRRSILQGVDKFSLPKASADQLVRTSKSNWGDYISNQVDAQFFARMVDPGEIMRTGTASTSGYEAWFEPDPETAQRYTEAQHNGSLTTAYALHKRFPNPAEQFPEMRMHDFGGGSGAFDCYRA